MRYFPILTIICCLCCTDASAREKGKLPLAFELKCGEQPLQIGRQYRVGSSTLQLGELKFYISAIGLYDGNKLIWEERQSYHLIDATVPSSLQLLLSIPRGIDFDAIRFSLGIDSTTNVSGAMGGDLDPSRGMYWTWQSGYINFKVEGSSPACNTRNNEFHFHIGGYSAPFASVRDIKLSIGSKDQLVIVADIGRFFEGGDLSAQNDITIPGPEAVNLSRKAATIFSIRQ